MPLCTPAPLFLTPSPFQDHILRSTSLQLVALSSRPTSQTIDTLLSSASYDQSWESRIHPFQVDGLSDRFDAQLETAAGEINASLGKNVRLIVCSSGIVSSFTFQS